MSDGVRLENGWIRVPYSGPELARVEIAAGELTPGPWSPAYLDTTLDGRRVAQVRPPAGGQTMKVWMKIDHGAPMLVGQIGQAARRR